jgi:hypothetical protein
MDRDGLMSCEPNAQDEQTNNYAQVMLVLTKEVRMHGENIHKEILTKKLTVYRENLGMSNYTIGNDFG